MYIIIGCQAQKLSILILKEITFFFFSREATLELALLVS